MNSRGTWTWFTLALVLVMLVLVHRRFERPRNLQLGLVLPRLEPDKVLSIQITPKGQREIHAVRTNGTWQLVAPMVYPAQSIVIEMFLSELRRLVPATFIGPAELEDRPTADDDYGFRTPLASVVINQGAYRAHLLIGARTAPGDQFFLQVVGVEGVHVVDAELLKLLPRDVNDLRDTTFASLAGIAFNRISVTNGARFFELERERPDKPWRMMSPIEARADSERVEGLLQKLESLRVSQFVSDDTTPDLDAFGLQPGDLEIALKQGTNPAVHLRFGKTPTNSPAQVFAQRLGFSSIVTVPKEVLLPWRGSVNDFRDPHLVALQGEIAQIEIRAADQFTLDRQTNGAWRVMPPGYAADAATVHELLSTLSSTKIIEFTKDVVTAIDLASYGLAEPSRKYILIATSEPESKATNRVLAQLDFGTNSNERVFVRRSDESSVYAIQLRDFQRLPVAALQMRERQIWDFSEEDVAGVIIQHKGRTRQLFRKASHDWSLAPGSQGIINELAIEESIKPLCRLTALGWVARGSQNREKYGFVEGAYRLTLDLKSGRKLTLELGAPAGEDSAFAAVTLEGDLWIFEMPSAAYRFLATYLTVPENSL